MIHLTCHYRSINRDRYYIIVVCPPNNYHSPIIVCLKISDIILPSKHLINYALDLITLYFYFQQFHKSYIFIIAEELNLLLLIWAISPLTFQYGILTIPRCGNS